MSGATGPSFALDAVAPDVPDVLPPDSVRRFEFVVKRLSLAAIRRYVRIVDVDRWQEACGWMGDVLDYARAASELAEATGSDPSQVPAPIAPLIPMMKVLDANEFTTSAAPGFRMAILGLVTTMLTSTRRRAGIARESAATFAAETPKLRAMANLVNSLPKELRPTIDPTHGLVFLARLPEEDRERAMTLTRQWLADHPDQDRAITGPNPQAIPGST